MKKTTLTILLTLLSFGFVLAQTNLIVTAPNGTTTTQLRLQMVYQIMRI